MKVENTDTVWMGERDFKELQKSMYWSEKQS